MDVVTDRRPQRSRGTLERPGLDARPVSFHKHANNETNMPQSGRPKMKLEMSAADHFSSNVARNSLWSQHTSRSSSLLMVCQSTEARPDATSAITTLRQTNVTR